MRRREDNIKVHLREIERECQHCLQLAQDMDQ
jgi:hypothetical protein